MNNLHILYAGQKVFVGDLEGGRVLKEVVECVSFIDGQGRVMVAAHLVGDIKDWRGEYVLVSLSNKSAYYKEYVRATTGVSSVITMPGGGIH